MAISYTAFKLSNILMERRVLMEVIKISEFSRKYVESIFEKNFLADKSICEKYSKWLLVFKLSHGEFDTQRKIDFEKLNNQYRVKMKGHDDLFKLIFCLDNLYGTLLVLFAGKSLDETFSVNEIDKYLNFSFFRHIGIINYHPPQNLLFYTADFYKNDLISEILTFVTKWESNHNSSIDYVREIFHSIYPREVRHSLGEFYTPDWLAEHSILNTLEDSDYQRPNNVFLDPTCGSGTFLLAVENVLKNKGSKVDIESLYGFDINPISAFAAKTNLLIRFRDDVINREETILKIFTSNILDVNEEGEVGDLEFDRRKLFSNLKNISLGKDGYLQKEVDHLCELEYSAALMRNFADVILGNPPWVNWEYLPKEYKEKTISNWSKYGLFEFKGMNSTFIKEDISTLISYVAIDHFLKESGKISFVVKESLFKSMKQGTGFRKFYLKNKNLSFSINQVEDLTSFNPFYGVKNKTVIFYAKKNDVTVYPVNYRVWIPKKSKTTKDTEKLNNVLKMFTFENRVALPLDMNSKESGWITVTKKMYENLIHYLGKPDYRARTGVFTGGANGIYWLDIVKEISNNLVEVQNITEKAKNQFEKVKMIVEKKLIYPYMSGSELFFWDYKYSKFIICPHNSQTKMYPFDVIEMEECFLNGFNYFKHFEKDLKKRKGFTSLDKKIHQKYFYTLQRIGDYTFSPYKVAWKYIASSFTCAVIENVDDKILGETNIIPNEKIIYIGLDSKEEAFYLCGLLSSTSFREIINSFKVSTQISPSVINELKIPKYNSMNSSHRDISIACEQGHLDSSLIDDCIKLIDRKVLSAIAD